MNIIFPQHLNEAGYQYRHVKIHILQSKTKEDDALSSADALISQSEAAAKAMGQGALETLTSGGSGGFKEVLNKSNKVMQQIESVFKGGTTRLHTITLPLPNSLNDNAVHDWSANKGVVGSLMEGFDSSIVGKAMSVAADMSNVRKPLADPGYYQNYAGTQPREFNLSFDLVPNNATEAGDIYLILHLLRKYSSPTTAINHALVLAPYYFQLEFNNPYINSMIRANDVVLKSISTDYGADGNMQQTADGMPKHIRLDLTFAERKMMTSEMY